MRRSLYLIFVAALAVHVVLARGGRYEFPSSSRVILPTASAVMLLQQCSRGTPEGARDFWAPTDAQLNKLETGLVAYLDATSSENSPPAGVYHRQYIGFTNRDHRFIYGNFYPGEKELTKYERTQPVVICDGGSSFWGVVYDLETEKFFDLAFNGVG